MVHNIYKDTDETMDYFYRNEKNTVCHDVRNRGELYLEFATKVYDWQKQKLLSSTGLYWDTMGADGTILVSRGYRQHVVCGGPGGNYYSYNIGTMIAGAAELHKATGDERFL